MDEDLIPKLALLVLIGFVVLAIIDGAGSNKVNYVGKVTNHNYTPAQHWTSVDSKGNLSSHSTSDDYSLFVIDTEGRVHKLTVGLQVYGTVEDGNQINFTEWQGCITGWSWREKVNDW